jgi:threonine dehydrogenase-like Zn-dependent dehydrogenase
MKAQTVYFVQPGKAEVREEPVPDPAAGQIQVQCVANGICMAEVSLFTGAEPSKFPRVVGHEGIGIVTKAGKDARNIAEGDYVVCGRWSSLMNLDAATAIKYNKLPADPALYLTEPVACIVVALYEYDITWRAARQCC